MKTEDIHKLTLEQLYALSDMYDQKIEEERQRLKDIHSGGYYFIGNGSGISYLCQEDAIMCVEVNSEIDRRTRISSSECRERVFIKRKLRKLKIGFNQDSSTKELKGLLQTKNKYYENKIY